MPLYNSVHFFQVTLDDLPYLAKLKPVLQSMFAVSQVSMYQRDKTYNSEIEMLSRDLAKKENVHNQKDCFSSSGQETKEGINGDGACPKEKQNTYSASKKNRQMKKSGKRLSKTGDKEKFEQTKERENVNKIDDRVKTFLTEDTELCAVQNHKDIIENLKEKIKTKEYDIQDYDIVGKLMGQEPDNDKEEDLVEIICDHSTLTSETKSNLGKRTDSVSENTKSMGDKLEQIKIKFKK